MEAVAYDCPSRFIAAPPIGGWYVYRSRFGFGRSVSPGWNEDGKGPRPCAAPRRFRIRQCGLCGWRPRCGDPVAESLPVAWQATLAAVMAL